MGHPKPENGLLFERAGEEYRADREGVERVLRQYTDTLTIKKRQTPGLGAGVQFTAVPDR